MKLINIILLFVVTFNALAETPPPPIVRQDTGRVISSPMPFITWGINMYGASIIVDTLGLLKRPKQESSVPPPPVINQQSTKENENYY